MKTAALFVDTGNLYFSVGKKFNDRKVNYQKMIESTRELFNLSRALAYPIVKDNECPNFVRTLEGYGYEIRSKRAKTYKDEQGAIQYRRTFVDVAIAVDIVRLINKLDVVVLASASLELIPIINWIQEQGVEARLLACGIATELKQTANFWKEIDESMVLSS